AVLRKVIEWHPMYNTLGNVTSDKLKFFFLWPITYFLLFIRLGVNKVLYQGAVVAAIAAGTAYATLQNARPRADKLFMACSGLRPRSKGCCPCRAALGSPHSPPWGSGRG